MPYGLFVHAIPVPARPSEEFKGIKGGESEHGIKVTDGIDHVILLGEVLMPNELVSSSLKILCQAIHVKVDQVPWQIEVEPGPT